jgi:hypothetical protein
MWEFPRWLHSQLLEYVFRSGTRYFITITPYRIPLPDNYLRQLKSFTNCTIWFLNPFGYYPSTWALLSHVISFRAISQSLFCTHFLVPPIHPPLRFCINEQDCTTVFQLELYIGCVYWWSVDGWGRERHISMWLAIGVIIPAPQWLLWGD